MKALHFKAITDERVRITIPYANRKVLSTKLGVTLQDFKNAVVEFEIKSIRFMNGKKEDFKQLNREQVQ